MKTLLSDVPHVESSPRKGPTRARGAEGVRTSGPVGGAVAVHSLDQLLKMFARFHLTLLAG